MFKSELTNGIIRIIGFLILMTVSLNIFSSDTLSNTLIVFVLSLFILFNLNKIIKIKNQKAN